MKRLTTLFSTFFFLLVLSTTAWAIPPASDVDCTNPCINSYEIEDGAVGSADITDGAVDTADIADGAITDAKVTGPISRGNLETASNRVVVASSGGDFATITAALAAIAPSAANPFVIDVMPGTYTENVIMKSYVHLRGAGREVTTIQASSGTVLTLTNLTDVSISGLTIKGAQWGIYNNNSSPTITGNIIEDNSKDGINSDNASSPVIEGNIMRGNDNGVYNLNASATIIGNVFDANSYTGIWHYSGTGLKAIGNVFTGNYHGIRTDEGSATISGNTFSGHGYSGMYLMSITGEIVSNTIRDSNRYGIVLDGGVPAKISGNTITNSNEGISAYNSAAIITGNSITGNVTGVGTYNGDEPMLTNNVITGNSSWDLNLTGTPNVSQNVYDTISGTPTGAYNVKSDGTPW